MIAFKKRFVTWTVCGMAAVIAVLFLSHRIWTSGQPQATAQKTALAPCPIFSGTEQSCTFDAAIMWVKTGTVPNFQPCIIPMPDRGGYRLWQGDGTAPPVIWTPDTPLPTVNIYGFQSLGGTRSVKYRLVQFADHCGSYF